MSNSTQFLVDIMQDPFNRVLYIIDTTGSSSETDISNGLDEVNLLKDVFDLLDERILTITDEFMKSSGKPQSVLPITTRNPPFLCGYGGGVDFLKGIEEIPWMEEFNPTHVVYSTDMMGLFPPKREEIAFLNGKQMSFMLLDNIHPESLAALKKEHHELGAVIPTATPTQRAAVYAERIAKSIEAQTQPVSAPRRRMGL